MESQELPDNVITFLQDVHKGLLKSGIFNEDNTKMSDFGATFMDNIPYMKEVAKRENLAFMLVKQSSGVFDAIIVLDLDTKESYRVNDFSAENFSPLEGKEFRDVSQVVEKLEPFLNDGQVDKDERKAIGDLRQIFKNVDITFIDNKDGGDHLAVSHDSYKHANTAVYLGELNSCKDEDMAKHHR